MKPIPFRRPIFLSVAQMLAVFALCGGVCCLAAAQVPVPARTLLPGGTYYPRVVRLAHGAAEAQGRLVASTDGVIFESTDDGATFTNFATVPVVAGSKHVCCSTLYEVPRNVGSLKAGTLLSAGTYAVSPDGKSTPKLNETDFNGAEPAIEIYASTDSGRTWKYLSTPVHGGPALPSTKPVKQRVLWEPEFELAADGALVMFVSDETDACCSQKLIRIRTMDGVHWRDKSDVIAMPALPGARPGMIVSTPVAGGGFFMSYEICGDRFHCDVFTRTSRDGWNFGDAASPGTRAETAAGQHFRHSPGNTFAPGQLLLIGQMLYEENKTVSPSNGQVYFTNTHLDGTGPWSLRQAPVAVPTAYDNYCPNYSSALLPSGDGSALLELASDYDEQRRCVTFLGRGVLASTVLEARVP